MVLQKRILLPGQTVNIGGSKSLSNRLLILQSLYKTIDILNLSDSQDTSLLMKALHDTSTVIDIHHAGTAMRFLTAYFSILEGRTVTLTGSERMQQRPIKSLVNALRQMGADIQYIDNEGFPPLKITGKALEENKVDIPATISSQFISALLLIGGRLRNGLKINLIGDITSLPYLEMTLKMLAEIGIKTNFEGNTITVFPAEGNLPHKSYTVESDWSSASYFYAICAIGRQDICLKSFRGDSLQGDAIIAKLYEEYFGITTVFNPSTYEINLKPKADHQLPKKIILDMNSCPDIAQTLCVTAATLNIQFEITGLATLKVKETDRLQALKNELEKIGCLTEITENSIKTTAFTAATHPIIIETYNDHRMAMCFAPFSLVKPLTINNPEVVKKSYPKFWEDFAAVTHPA